MSHYEFVLQKHCDYRLEKQTSVPQMLKKMKNRRKLEGEANNMQLDEEDTHVLNEATRIVNVFLISWFFYLFLLCSISLIVKYNLILRYEAWVNVIRTSWFHWKLSQISAKPFAFQWNLLGKLSQNWLFFTNRFSTLKLNSHEIPVKLAVFFLRIFPRKSWEIVLFFPWPKNYFLYYFSLEVKFV